MAFTIHRAQQDAHSTSGESFDITLERADNGPDDEYHVPTVELRLSMSNAADRYMEIPLDWFEGFAETLPKVIAEARRTGVLPTAPDKDLHEMALRRLGVEPDDQPPAA